MYFGDFSSSLEVREDGFSLLEKADTDGKGGEIDQLVAGLISAALAAKASGDNEVSRRTAREVLRYVQKNKADPNRPFYLTLAKAINAYCSDREDRARLLLKRIILEQEQAGEQIKVSQSRLTQAHEDFAFAVVASCQILI